MGFAFSVLLPVGSTTWLVKAVDIVVSGGSGSAFGMTRQTRKAPVSPRPVSFILRQLAKKKSS